MSKAGLLNTLGGWHRTGFQLRGLAQGYLPVLAVSIPASFADVASATQAPVVTAGDAIPLDVDGYCIRIDTSGGQTIADPTRMVVNIARAGYSGAGGGGPTLNDDLAFGSKLLRRTFPNEASNILANGSSFLLALDDLLHAADSIRSVVLRAGFFTGQVRDIVIPGNVVERLDTIGYERPRIRPVTLPYRRFTTTAVVEFMVQSTWATNGQQVARVECTWKSGGVYGPWASANTMVRSSATPESGRRPGLWALPVYAVEVDVSGCPQSTARGDAIFVYRAFSFFGNAVYDSELHGDPLQANGLPTSLSPPAGLPFVKDAVGNHSACFAWVNRDGSGLAGTSVAGVSTSSADPGASLSYVSEAAALAAIRLFNSNAANRPNPHNTTSGGHVMFREVAGGALGDSTTAYWQRASLSGFSDGVRPPVMQGAPWASTGTTSLNVRRRGVQDNGSTTATAKNVGGVFEWRGITFDATGITGAGHLVLDGDPGGVATTAAAATTGMILVDCDLRENRLATASFPMFFRAGWRWDWRVDHSGPVGPGSVGNGAANFAGIMVAVGSLYASDISGVTTMVPTAFGGCQFDNIGLASQSTGPAPDISNSIVFHCRVDAEQPSSPLFRPAEDGRVNIGRGVCGLFLRKTGTTVGPLSQISADGLMNACDQISLQHMGLCAGDSSSTDNDRLNICYGDQGYLQSIKRASFQYNAFGSLNIKDGVFNAPEALGLGSFTTGWAANTRYIANTMRHDNNATNTARLWYVAVSNFTSGASQSTDLADTGRWRLLGALHGIPFGAQPRRTGNWRTRHHVHCFGNIIQKSAFGTVATLGPTSWAGEVLGRGSQFLQVSQPAARANYYKRRTGGTIAPLADRGDYRPQSIAAGDPVDSPLLNMVPAGRAVVPFDPLGTPRRNDGTGAAGWLERSA